MDGSKGSKGPLLLSHAGVGSLVCMRRATSDVKHLRTLTLDLVIHPLALVVVPAREDVAAPAPAVLVLEVALVAPAVCVLCFPMPATVMLLPERISREAPSDITHLQELAL